MLLIIVGLVTGFLLWAIGSACEKHEIERNVQKLDEWRRSLPETRR